MNKKILVIILMLVLIIFFPVVNKDGDKKFVRSPYYEVQLRKALGEPRPKINVTSINSNNLSLIGGK